MLLTSIQSGEVAAQSIESIDRIEALRRILMTKGRAEVQYEEAREVAMALLEFYEILASEKSIQDESSL